MKGKTILEAYLARLNRTTQVFIIFYLNILDVNLVKIFYDKDSANVSQENIINNLQYNTTTMENQEECGCFDVLICDDDHLSISYLRNVVKQKHAKFICASNGEEAYHKIKELFESNCNLCVNKSLIILMDINMPVMNGVKSAILIDELFQSANKERTKVSEIKLYFITGNTESQYMDHIKDISICKGCYNKPITKRDLLSII
jgi:CheY-like chemotaxis protein